MKEPRYKCFLSGQALLHPEIQEMKEIHRFSEKKKIPFYIPFT